MRYMKIIQECRDRDERVEIKIKLLNYTSVNTDKFNLKIKNTTVYCSNTHKIRR